MRLSDGLSFPRTALVLATLGLLYPCLARATDWQDGDVIVRVADQVITYGEFKEAWMSSPLAGADLEGAEGRRLKLSILRPLVDRRLMYLDALRSGVAEDPEFLKLFAPYQARAKHQGQDLSDFRMIALAAAHYKATRNRFTPSDDELQGLYAERKDVTTLPEKIRLQIVVVEDRDLAESIATQARGGTNLNLLAQRHSIVPSAQEDLGVLGWVARGEGEPTLEEAAFALKEGEIGGPVEGSNGWYVLRVLGRKPEYVRPLAEARPLLLRKVREERLEAHLQALARELQPVVDPAFVAIPGDRDGAEAADHTQGS